MDIKSHIRDVHDFPREGICFHDITPLLQNFEAFSQAVDSMLEMVEGVDFDKIVAIESRGFIFASALCLKMGKGMVLVRKMGKLPHSTQAESYDLEYGTDSLEIHKDAVSKGEKVLVVDDLLATGGTAEASGRLVRSIGGQVAGYLFLIELAGLGGASKLEESVFSVIQFQV
ncbi:MAG: adenine phosphoribosyltransferase [Candidatus Mycalebacterium zealandia]|nr:MAG: adenine phosphoribosyltransferase [Candidatus Mycalebacterium zealandia]